MIIVWPGIVGEFVGGPHVVPYRLTFNTFSSFSSNFEAIFHNLCCLNLDKRNGCTVHIYHNR